MVGLKKKHFKLILNFSRKISPKKYKDLSQHVILEILTNGKKIDDFENESALNSYLYNFVKSTYYNDHSNFNRIEYETHQTLKRKKNVQIFDLQYKQDEYSSKEKLNEIIIKAKLTDKERMFLNAYIENNCNISNCEKSLDIGRQCITKYVNRAILKCKKSL